MIVVQGKSRIITIPSKKVIVDLASRSGPADKDSVCPYKGFRAEIDKLPAVFRYSGSIDKLLERDSNADFCAERIRPIKGPYVKHDTKPDVYETRLEDIDASWVYTYLRDLIIRLEYQDVDSIKSESQRLHIQNILFYDEDGVPTTEGDAMVDKPDYYFEDEFEWKEKLPLALKRIYYLSRKWKISLMSVIIAWEKMLVVRKNANKIQQTELKDCGIYLMEIDGTVRGKLQKTTATAWKSKAWPWISGANVEDSYYRDYLYIKHVCERRGIKLHLEDPLAYNKEFFDSLVVTAIPSNSEVFRRRNAHLPSNISTALKTMNLSEYGQLSYPKTSAPALDLHGLIFDTQIKFITLRNPIIETFINNVLPISDISAFISLYCKVGSSIVNPNALAVNPEGFVVSEMTGEALTLKFDWLEPSSAHVAIMHASGFVVAVSPSPELIYTTFDEVSRHIERLLSGREAFFSWKTVQ